MPVLSRKRLIRQAHKLFGERRARAITGWCYRARYWFRSPPFLKLKSVVVVEDLGVFVSGWMMDPGRSVTRIELVTNKGQLIDLLPALHWSDNRILLAKFGKLKSGLMPEFVGLVKCPDLIANADIESVRITARKHRGQRKKTLVRKVNLTVAAKDPLAAVKTILQQVPVQSPQKRELFDRVYGPALSSVWSLRDTSQTADEVVRYNTHLATSNPDVSLIIPIYGRFDFIEYQLNQFVLDEDMQRHEILYVVDDPRICDDVRQVASPLEKLHNLAFSIVYLGKNYGYAGANNRGVAAACGSSVLLLNSDVMPSAPGWLRQLILSVGDGIDTTLTGVRLLYDDETIQHDGMTFFDSPFVNGLWTNIHPGKGLPSGMAQSSPMLVDKEAVTGACVLMSRKNFLSLGGFDESYILGDYEDSDLCMRARQRGLTVQLNNQVTLYHLERQSQCMVTADKWKQELTYYNCWYHTQRWDDAIRAMKARSATDRVGDQQEPVLMRVASA